MFKNNELLGGLRLKLISQNVKTKMQKIFWPNLSKIFVIRGLDDFIMVEPKIKCEFIPISLDNYHRVVDFREENRISNYRDKLARNEIGYFAEHNGKMIGSVWATINKTDTPRVVQKFTKIMYNEALVHDNVVSEKFRGMRVGPFMEASMFIVLFSEYGVNRIKADVNVRNHASLQMLDKLNLRVDHRLLCIAVFNKVILELVLRKHN